MMTKKEFTEYLLRNIQADGNAKLLSASLQKIEMLDTRNGRRVTFNVNRPSTTSFKDQIHFGPSMIGRGIVLYTKRIANGLMWLNARNFVMMKHIFVVDGERDILAIRDRLGIMNVDWPDAATDGKSVGSFWWREQAIIINLAPLHELHRTERDDSDYAGTKSLFWKELLKQLRYSMFTYVPYPIPWLERDDGTDENVEAWADATFARLERQLVAM